MPRTSRTRIYLVMDSAGHRMLIRAKSSGRALKHALGKASYEVGVATQDDIIALLGKGVVVENAEGVEP